MIFHQITHDDLGCASYLIGDEDAGVAAHVVRVADGGVGTSRDHGWPIERPAATPAAR